MHNAQASPLFFKIFMKTLRDYVVAGALYLRDTGIEAQVGDQVKLYLDTEADPLFPEYILGVVQHPITRVNCNSATSYIFEYNEADLDGAADLIRPGNLVEVIVVSGLEVLNDALLQETADRIADVNAEEARALAAEALLAPKASPTFTGTVTLPPTTSIGGVTSVELGFLGGVTSSIQPQLELRAPLASPAFTGVPTAPTAANGTNTTQIASTAFVQALVASGFASTPQALSGAGAVNVTTLTTALTTTGPNQALTLADGVNGQLKIIVHDVDGGSAILTPTTRTGFSTITFTNVGETAILQFLNIRGWVIISLRGAVAV